MKHLISVSTKPAAAQSEDKLKPIVASAVALLLLTGCRVGEILNLQWGDVKGNRLKLRDSKTCPRTVWLGDEARAIIDGLPRWRNVPWLFWSSGYRKQLRAIDHHWYGVRDSGPATRKASRPAPYVRKSCSDEPGDTADD